MPLFPDLFIMPNLPARLGLAAMMALSLPGAAPAQPGGNPTVSWTLAPASKAPLHPGDKVRLVLQGVVREGWHVYAFKQKENGPTPLKVTLDQGPVALPDGPASGSAPIVAHDPAFNLDTPYYTHSFAITVPVRLKPHAAAGRQQLPVTVRFQTCNGATCEPPKTLHLTAAVDVAARG
ncbi:protein-disulfide reductase DsbD domain-containing protein [Novosphingobium rosa]|uniref:protein-disulfide reductase DsbD domain-containing protein n=1 Tax=Novosphingobium rosa TaxID=76978 RepID=UPI00082FFF4C|nr:protein-disulfide reductase DsbD domain-containing protein [Novosphingobium rosa]